MNIYSNALLCTDFSKASVAAAEKANEIATTLGADLTVLHVVTYIPPQYAAIELPKELATVEYIIPQAEQHLSNWCTQHDLENGKQVIKTGNAKREISDYIKQNGIDLVVIGDRGESEILQPFGSVANYVIQHSDCDVLVAR